MIIDSVNTDEQVFIIAEIGNNHEGDFGLAEKMIHAAAEAGADAVKFQTFKAELLVGYANKARFQQLRSYEFSYKQFENLSDIAGRAGIIFLSTPFDIESARFLNGIVPAFKIASGDNDFYPLVEYVAGFGKPLILSAGMSGIAEINETCRRIDAVCRKDGIESQIGILHCVGSYPAPAEDLNLSVIGRLKNDLGCCIGYSDHALGIEAAVCAASAGARIIEKHFTIDKQQSDFRDHKLAADPGELTLMVNRIRQVEMFLGNGEKSIMPSEQVNSVMLRRSISASRDLKEGMVVSAEDITWIRPGDGIRPGRESEVIGRTLLKDIGRGEQFKMEDLK